MKNIQDFMGVKFTSKGWSISSRSAGNVGYLSRALAQAIAFIPASMVSVVGGSLERLADSELIVVKNIESLDDDLLVILEDLSGEVSVSVKLKGQVVKKPNLVVGAIVKMRRVSTGYVLLLGGSTISVVKQKNNLMPSIS